mmetsp:Transcript_12358/g.43526  ORF Transcript_12358/g.43526 Transcript_12358/m.43526 type:complete len:205 (+) Transcript_12358:34-648(+)
MGLTICRGCLAVLKPCGCAGRRLGGCKPATSSRTPCALPRPLGRRRRASACSGRTPPRGKPPSHAPRAPRPWRSRCSRPCRPPSSPTPSNRCERHAGARRRRGWQQCGDRSHLMTRSVPGTWLYTGNQNPNVFGAACLPPGPASTEASVVRGATSLPVAGDATVGGNSLLPPAAAATMMTPFLDCSSDGVVGVWSSVEPSATAG